jgi:hypothetical protein
MSSDTPVFKEKIVYIYLFINNICFVIFVLHVNGSIPIQNFLRSNVFLLPYFLSFTL